MNANTDLIFVPLKTFKTPTERKIEKANQVAYEEVNKVIQLANGNSLFF